MLRMLIFDVADVEFRCCRHVMLGVLSRGRRAPNVRCLHATWVTTWIVASPVLEGWRGVTTSLITW
jgi:hypothetical protein